MTAYILIALLDAGHKPESPVIRKATQCVAENFALFEEDSYALSIMAYLFAKLKHDSAYSASMQILEGLATREGMKD